MIRTLTGITYGDGYEYSNSRGEIIGRYADIKKDGEIIRNIY